MYYYVYMITEISTGMKYIGSRGSIHPPEIDIITYGTSSFIKNKILNNTHDYIFDILSTHTDRQSAYNEEARLHASIDVASHPNYYNIVNQSDKFNTSGITRVKDRYGNRYTVRVDNPDYVSGNLVHIHKGIAHSQEYKDKMSRRLTGRQNHMFGRSHTDETKQKISKTKTGQQLNECNPNAKSITTDGIIFKTMKDACQYHGISKSTMIRRLKSIEYLNWFYTIKYK